MKNNQTETLDKQYKELPIEKEYQEAIFKWLDWLAARTGLPVERIVTEIFLHRMQEDHRKQHNPHQNQ
jgi:hypothetical protein